MARKYKTVEINGVKYELHPVKADDKKIGSVPVRMFDAPEDFQQFVVDANAGDVALIEADWRYGNAVRLQGTARKNATGGGFTQGDHDRIFNELSLADPEWLVGFSGKSKEMESAIRDEFNRQQAEGMQETDENKVWTELV